MSHDLTPEDFTARFDQRIRRRWGQRISRPGATDGQPTVVCTGAQPAAGKSRANAMVEREDPRLIPVIGDDLRKFHPDYDDLMTHDPLAMPDATVQASGQWVGMSNEYLRSRGASVLVETTLRQEHVLLGELQKFKNAGYVTDLHVLAIPRRSLGPPP